MLAGAVNALAAADGELSVTAVDDKGNFCSDALSCAGPVVTSCPLRSVIDVRKFRMHAPGILRHSFMSTDRRYRRNDFKHACESDADCSSCVLSVNDNCLARILVVNARSLAKNNAVQLLETDLSSFNIDIAAVTETWLHKAHSDSYVSIKGYSIFRLDRMGRKGGGVCIYVRDGLFTALLQTANHMFGIANKHELMWLFARKHNMEYVVGVLYHPPKALYNLDDLISRLNSDIEEIMSLHPKASLFLVGDFNRLNLDKFSADNGLFQIVTEYTRGTHMLDLCYTSCPDIFKCSVVKPLISSDHNALLICGSSDGVAPRVQALSKSRRVIKFYDVREQHIMCLSKALMEHNWNGILLDDNVSSSYDSLTTTLHQFINQFIPIRQVTITEGCPTFITPLIKSLLRKRNHFMRKGQLDKANNLSVKVGKLISEHRSNILSGVDYKSSKELWASVQHTFRAGSCSSSLSARFGCKFADINAINDYFANIATDKNYDSTVIEHLIDSLPVSSLSREVMFSEFEVFKMLISVKKTAAGIDRLPYWLFRECAGILTPIVTHVFNVILNSGTPPSSWKCAIVTPIPKISQPKNFQDLRPISVTPILSRLFERLIVFKFLLPAMPKPLFNDQFAFRPTGSTTAALIYVLHHITRMLENNSYVRCLFIDYSRAFDTINHELLIRKLITFGLHANVVKWIANFLMGRTQAVSADGKLSSWLSISQSIVQGSGIGPFLYIFFASDLKVKSVVNLLCKYADDGTLMVPEKTDICLEDEFQHILLWSSQNKLNLNFDKTKEMVFHRPSFHHFVEPSLLDNIERVTSFKLLGVLLTNTLSMDKHVNYILSLVNQRLYLLNMLKKQGLSGKAREIIFQALIISRLSYALPAYSGFLSCSHIARFNAVFRKSVKWGIIDRRFDAETLVADAQSRLFKRFKSDTEHCLNQLLPELRNANYGLRKRGHEFLLPAASRALFKKSFIVDCLYKYR
jgi:hypothetical protein